MAYYEASKPITELRNKLREKYLEQIERAERAALAVQAEPRQTFRLRVTQAVGAEAIDITERDLHLRWRNHPQLSSIVSAIHSQLCSFKMGQIAEIAEQCLQDETYTNHVALD